MICICTTYFFLLISTSILTFENLSFSAHGFYINSDVTVTPVYDKALREFYHSNIDHMNFKDKVSSKELINEFIEESTDGKIDEMLEQMPDPDSKLVVVDAMTLDTKWLYSFDERKTFDKGMFFLPSQER